MYIFVVYIFFGVFVLHVEVFSMFVRVCVYLRV